MCNLMGENGRGSRVNACLLAVMVALAVLATPAVGQGQTVTEPAVPRKMMVRSVVEEPASARYRTSFAGGSLLSNYVYERAREEAERGTNGR